MRVWAYRGWNLWIAAVVGILSLYFAGTAMAPRYAPPVPYLDMDAPGDMATAREGR